jgi:hypothetical protein
MAKCVAGKISKKLKELLEKNAINNDVSTINLLNGLIEEFDTISVKSELLNNFKTILKSATRYMRLTDENVMDPIAEDVLKFSRIDELLKELEKKGVKKFKSVLGSGTGNIVVETDIGGVRIGFGDLAKTINSQNVIPVIAQGSVGTLRYQIVPIADTKGITEEDVETIKLKLKAEGLEFSDPGTDNLGRINGKLVVIDLGAVSKQTDNIANLYNQSICGIK